MAAYTALAFLSFLWGSSFLLIKIASRAFDPFAFALARVTVAAAAMLLTSAFAGKVWPGSRPGLWVKLLALALIGQVVPFLLLGQAATLDQRRYPHIKADYSWRHGDVWATVWATSDALQPQHPPNTTLRDRRR
jgi:EamA-like transporter family